jgi:HEPN domain-containing protein
VRTYTGGSSFITWTPDKFRRLKKAYENAVKRQQDTFTFEGHEFVQGYAKYLIEYLDAQFQR